MLPLERTHNAITSGVMIVWKSFHRGNKGGESGEWFDRDLRISTFEPEKLQMSEIRAATKASKAVSELIMKERLTELSSYASHTLSIFSIELPLLDKPLT